MKSQSLEQKLDLLMSLAADDREGLPPRLRHTNDVGALRPLNIRNLRPSPGTRMSLLRILMTNACSYNCHYCPMRRDRPMPRTLLKPEELVLIFLEARRRGWCQGLFITTGIPGRPTKIMDDLIEVLELLRERHRFGGYIHVKLVAGSETSQIDRLTALASRVSLNFEAPCGKSLAQIAPEKSFATTLHDFERVRKLVVLEREAQAHGKPMDPLQPEALRQTIHSWSALPQTPTAHCWAPSPSSRPAAACTTLISAHSGPSARHRWKARRRPRHCASTGFIRRPICWESTDSGRRRSSTSRPEIFRSPSTPRVRGRWRTPRISRSKSARHRTKSSCGSRASDPWPHAGSSPYEARLPSAAWPTFESSAWSPPEPEAS